MSAGVIVGLEHHLEADLVTAVEASRDLVVVRRCADCAELLSTAAAGVGDIAVVSPGFRGVDREALRTLAGHGVLVAGLVLAGDEEGERRLRQLGVSAILHGGREVLDLAPLESLRSTAGSELAQPPKVGTPGDLFGPGQVWGPGVAAPGGDDPANAAGAIVSAVWGPTGAPGRTTVATGLASLLAARGASTLLVDLDTWGASVAQVLGLVDEAPGLAAAARAAEQGTLDVPSLSRVTPEVRPRLRVLTGLPAPHRWPEARSAAVEHVLAIARCLAEHVVLDCGFAIEDDEELSYDTAAPRRNAATLAGLAAADALVIVGAADPVGLQRLVRARSAVGTVPSPEPLVVVNKVRASVAGAHPERAIRDVLRRFAGLDDPLFVPWAPEECDGALLAGRAVPELHPGGRVATALSVVLDRMLPQTAPQSRTERRRRSRR